MQFNGTCSLIAVLTAISSSGCADTSSIRPVALSTSQFDEAVFQGESAAVSTNTSNADEYRVFHQGATGFVSVQTIRESAEKRATEFCDRRGRSTQVLRETTSKPPHILGNYPRVELVFACVGESASAVPTNGDPKYTKLINLKRLLDGGVLSRDEFEREKAKILSQP